MTTEKTYFEQGNLFDNGIEQENLFKLVGQGKVEQGKLPTQDSVKKHIDESMIEQENLSHDQTENLVLDEEPENRLCEHNRVREECEYCKKVFSTKMLKLQREQEMKRNKSTIGMVLIGTKECWEGYNKPENILINGDIQKKENKENKMPNTKSNKKVRGKLKKNIGFSNRWPQALNTLLKEHFWVNFRMNLSSGYPAQSTITLDGVRCKIISGEGGFHIKVPFQKKK